MSAPLPGTRFGAINAWPDPDGGEDRGRWLYMLRAPAPQRNPAGKAQLTVIEAGEMLVLTLGTILSADEPALAEARAAIAHVAGVQADDVVLRPATATATDARLLIERDGEKPMELAHARPSPGIPHSAAFSAMLRGDPAKAATAALKGGGGRLIVTYDIDLPGQRTATAVVQGNPGDEADVERAIADGRLKLTMTADDGASATLRDQTIREAMAAARHAITALPAVSECGSHQQHGSTARTIEGRATRVEPDIRKLTLAANVADWL